MFFSRPIDSFSFRQTLDCVTKKGNEWAPMVFGVLALVVLALTRSSLGAFQKTIPGHSVTYMTISTGGLSLLLLSRLCLCCLFQKKEVAHFSLFAPAPGKCVEILVKKGDRVQKGSALCILETMKMQNTLRASFSGKVQEVYVTQDSIVDCGKLILKVEI